jgi:hypothetical protein
VQQLAQLALELFEVPLGVVGVEGVGVVLGPNEGDVVHTVFCIPLRVVCVLMISAVEDTDGG